MMSIYKVNKIFSIFVIVLFMLLYYSFNVSADKGFISIPPIPIREDWQMAIIAWNGKEEVMILSNVLYPVNIKKSLNNSVLYGIEILPLKNKPEIKGSGYESFYILEKIISREGLGYQTYGPPALFYKKGDRIEVIYTKRIGPHYITVLNVNDFYSLTTWLKDYLISKGIFFNNESYLLKYSSIFKDYMDRGYNFFAIDVVILNMTDKNSYMVPYIVNPLLYKFSSKCIYYPLKISAMFTGETYIKLYLLTSERIRPEDIHSLGFEIHYEKRINIKEISHIDYELINLFKGSSKIWLTALTYRGNISNFKKDIEAYTGFSIWQYFHYILFITPILLSVIVSLIVIKRMRG
ncbi:MAG: DUF2330 domain-containing protein [Thermoproteales archaeon]|nr:DUF2330 domain-containing protein [Thermoproteales archaeon]